MKITTNLNTFGIESNPIHILVVMLNIEENELVEIKNLIKTEQEEEEKKNNLITSDDLIDKDLKKLFKIEEIKKLYKIKNQIENVEEIENLIISKLSIRDL